MALLPLLGHQRDSHDFACLEQLARQAGFGGVRGGIAGEVTQTMTGALVGSLGGGGTAGPITVAQGQGGGPSPGSKTSGNSAHGTFAQAAEVALAEVGLRTSRHRATAEYRAEMIRSQLPRTLAKAVERAKAGRAVPEGVGM